MYTYSAKAVAPIAVLRKEMLDFLKSVKLNSYYVFLMEVEDKRQMKKEIPVVDVSVTMRHFNTHDPKLDKKILVRNVPAAPGCVYTISDIVHTLNAEIKSSTTFDPPYPEVIFL